MDSAQSFYQTLTTISFTLLVIWFSVMQFSHGGWRSDPARHRATVHIALHFFLPGMLGLASLLSSPTDGGLIWRSAFILAGAIGATEAVQFLGSPIGLNGSVHRLLRTADPLLYLALVVCAFIPAKSLVLTPLQIGGMVNGTIFLIGMTYVWLAFAEPPPPEPDADPEAGAGEPARGRPSERG